MFYEFNTYVAEEKIYLFEKNFYLGELTTDILSITREEFSKMQEFASKIEKSSDALDKLDNLLRKRKLFSLMPEVEIPSKFYIDIIRDIYAFNQTMFYFIDDHIMKLKILNPENYAFALYDFLNDERAHKKIVNFIDSGSFNFNTMDNVKVSFVPYEKEEDSFAIAEIYVISNLQFFLKLDFIKAMQRGHIIRRCENCKQFFLLTAGYKTAYCTRKIEGSKHTCRTLGAKIKDKEKSKNNPVIDSYRKAVNRVRSDMNRENISYDDYILAKDYLNDLKNEALLKLNTSDYVEVVSELDVKFEKMSLYKHLGISFKGRC